MRKLKLLLCLPALLLFTQADAKIIYVKAGVSGSSNTGDSWANAYDNLQAALDNAGALDTIFVAKGVYHPSVIAGSGTNSRDKTFLLTKHVYIFGGFEGTEDQLSDRVLTAENRSVLSGDLGTLNDTSDNAYHVVTVVSLPGRASLDGFHIMHGNASGSGTATVNSAQLSRNSGGGIYLENSPITLKNLTVDSNYAIFGGAGMNSHKSDFEMSHSAVTNNYIRGADIDEGGGGGIRNEKSSPILTDLTINNNTAYHVQGGGGMRNIDGSSPKLTKVVFKNNHSEIGNEGDGGGAMYNLDGSNAILKDVVFESNTTDGEAGAMYNDGSVPEMTDGFFIANKAAEGGAIENDAGSHAVFTNVIFRNNVASSGSGGAMQNWKSSPVFNNVIFEGNTTEEDGGAICNYTDCSPKLTNVIMRNNTAKGDGGAIYNRRGSSPIITNTLIYGNSAERGGGIYIVESHSTPSSPILTNVTIVNNSASVSGGGGYDDGKGSTKLRNSIITGNTAPSDEDIDAPATSMTTAVTAGIIGDLFVAGGLTLPTAVTGDIFVNPTGNDYRLASGSYAIDRGDGSFFNTGGNPDLSQITTDINGADRVMGTKIDLGAYEACTDTVQPTIAITADLSVINIDDVVTFTAAATNEGLQPSYLWLLNDVVIPGATGMSYIAVAGTDFQHGDVITAKVISSFSCANYDTATSNELEMVIETESISPLNGNATNIRLYPNPNNGSFRIQAVLASGTQYHFTIADISGRTIKTESFTTSSGNFEHGFHLNQLNPGLYFLTVEAVGEAKQVVRFVVK